MIPTCKTSSLLGNIYKVKSNHFWLYGLLCSYSYFLSVTISERRITYFGVATQSYLCIIIFFSDRGFSPANDPSEPIYVDPSMFENTKPCLWKFKYNMEGIRNFSEMRIKNNASLLNYNLYWFVSLTFYNIKKNA